VIGGEGGGEVVEAPGEVGGLTGVGEEAGVETETIAVVVPSRSISSRADSGLQSGSWRPPASAMPALARSSR
jgi:hypothetical protein